MSATKPSSDTVVPGAAALLLCALLAVVPASGAAPPGGLSTQEPERNPRLDALRDAIETAFKHCDAAPLQKAFSPRVKTFLSSPALGVRQGYYGADQALVILRRAFKGRRTVRFRLADADEPTAQPGRAFLVGRWLYRDEGASKTMARLSFVLVQEGALWRIRELRELK